MTAIADIKDLDVRKPDHPIDPRFLTRHSPRAFTGEEVSEADLMSVLEAARWAPSASNSQPWRFLYARRSSPHFASFLDLLIPYNQDWAQHAGALVFVVSAKNFTAPGRTEARFSRSHSFDAGAAWMSLALQAHELGWVAHGMGGFDVERAREALKVPDDHQIEMVLALGRAGPKEILAERFWAGETPNGRRPITELAFEGGFGPG
jgi:nitroreductase